MIFKQIFFSILLTPFLVLSALAQPLAQLPFHQLKYVIYDNDDHRDVYTDEYLLALSHLGHINLLGIVSTYSPNEHEYNLFVEGRKEIVKKAADSGLKNLPKVFRGTKNKLQKPASKKIEDTEIISIDASNFVIEQAKKVTKENPLIFVTGGQLTVIANAFLIDSTIAKKVIVSGLFGVEKIDYNAGLDSWAWKIVLSKFKVLAIPIGPSSSRGKVYMKPPVVSKEKIFNKLPQHLSFFKWMYEKHHPSNVLPDGHDYDGQAVIPLMRPEYITQIKRWSATGIDKQGNVKLIEDQNGKIFEALDANQEVATKEFWRAMQSLAAAIK